METIFEPTSNFDFTKLSLGHPQTTKGGSYFTKLLLNEHSLYVQFPKCKTKQGIIQSEKNIYTDLLYETTYNNELNDWLENLETICQKLLYGKNNLWFSGDIDLNDIESAFTNVAKMYKSGKQFLIRCYVPKPQMIKNPPTCFVYDENEKQLVLNDVDVTKEIIPLIKIDGIKFTNKSFQLELNLSQVMVMNNKEELKNCLIKPSISNKTINNSQIQTITMHNINDNKEKNISNTSNNIILVSNEDEKIVSNISFPNEDETKSNTIEEYIINDSDIDNEHKDEDNDEEEEEEEEEEEDDEDDEEEDENENEEIEQYNHANKLTLEENNNNNNENIMNYGLQEVNDLEINIQNEFTQPKSKLSSTVHLERNSQQTKSLDEIKRNEHLELVNLNIDNINEHIKLRRPNEVYYEIYKAAREKAKRAKKFATEAYLEAKNIKIKYMLDNLDESDDDEHYSEKYQ
jgi:hypothetical protein